MTRKITTILLALALCLTLLPVGAGAVDTTTYTLKNSGNTLQYGSGESYTNVATTPDNSPVSVEYGNSTASVSVSGYVLDGGTAGATYTLGADVTIDKPLIIQGGTETNPVTLDLNGNVLKYSNGTNKNSVIVVDDGAHFTLTDSGATSRTLNYTVNLDTNAWISITDNSNSNSNINVTLGTASTDEKTTTGAITLTGGIITGGTGTKIYSDDDNTVFGGGVFVGQKATFNMTGGNIVGCTASSKGGGVYVSKATAFTMSGGSIVGCTATEADSNGGGVYVTGGTFNMEDSSRIVGCTADGSGGVYVGSSGAFNMKGGNIEGCTASSNNGGGVYVSGGRTTFTMEGGNIKNCTASSSGGGVYVSDSTFTMVGGNIQNCTAYNGGGVYVDGTLSASTMNANGGSVGGSVYLNGSYAALINTSGGDGTKFNGDITNNGGNTNKPTKDPADPTEQSREFLGWFVANTTGKGYKQVEFDSDGKTNDTGNILRAFWEGDFEVYTTSDQPPDRSGYYQTFAEAWDSSTGVSGESVTFKFLQNVNVGDLEVTKNPTFDLNGKTVSGNIKIDYSSDTGSIARSLIVKDTANGGKLSDTVTVKGNLGQLNVWGGTVNEVEVSDGGTVDCSGGTITTATVNTNGTLECNSGTITTATVNTGGTVKCIGGTITHLDDKGGTVNHTGGTATCTEKAKCDVCHQPYGEKDTTNHVNGCKSGWTVKSTTQHKKEYNLCGTVDVELQSHNWKDGECKDCGYICAHSGNSPTCTESSTCTICGKTLAAIGHSGTGYSCDSSKHWVSCAICGKPFKEAAHDFSSGNTCVCGYVKQTSHRTYRSSAPTISAVLSHSGAASATDYTSGIYGLTFRSTASFASFRGVQVDGKTIAGTNYIAEEGSIVVYLKAVYLQTLAKGSHTVTILSTEGNTTANFTIGGVQSAKTGDPGVAIYAVMALTSYTGTALVVRGRKRK